ncbi:hypothetical protein OBV_27970 [Oscillibacter valericigenes Sjm18-20]|nr:hypothetical protein OBV_27970 [Oscillibacter valericigenes Sjm18-20]
MDTTARAVRDVGYPVTLISDACTARDLEWAGEEFGQMWYRRFILPP